MDYEDETPLAEQFELDGDEHGDFDPTGDFYNEYHEGYSDDADDFEQRQLAADDEY